MPRIAVGAATPKLPVPQAPFSDVLEGPISVSVNESSDLDWSAGKFPTSVSVDEEGEITWQ